MSGSRLARLAAVAVGGALVLGLAPAALAAPNPVGIGVARTVSTRDNFSVPAWTDAAGATVRSVTATLRAGGDTVALPALTSSGNGFWTLGAALALTADGGKMPQLGRWDIDVTATDSSGNTVTDADAGTFDFTLRPQFTLLSGDTDGRLALTVTPSAITRDVDSVTVSGIALGTVPGPSGRTVPLAEEPVTITPQRDYGAPPAPPPSPVTATTTNTGAFTAAMPVDAYTTTFDAQLTVADDQADGSAQGDGGGRLQPTVATITAKANASRVAPGQPVTITGTVRAASADHTGLGDVAIQLQTDAADGPQTTTTTNSDGSFSATVTGIAGSGAWTAHVIDPLVSAPDVSHSLVVPDEASLLSPHVTVNSDGTVSASTTLVATYRRSSVSGSGEAIYLQHSNDGHTWTTITHAKTDENGALNLRGQAYVSGYYRLFHPISNQLAAATSTPVYRSRIVTRIAGNNASPEPIKKGKTISVSGTLQQAHSGWHAMPGQRVYLYFRARASKKYGGWLASGKTDRHGKIVLHTKATKDGYWLLQYFGDSAHFDTYATPDYVDVR